MKTLLEKYCAAFAPSGQEDELREMGYSYRMWQRVRQQLKNEKRVAYRCEVLDGGRQWHISETPPTA